jgi:hypothetical protein
VPTGPEAGTWRRDEIAHITVSGDFSATFETLSEFRGLKDGINYCRPRGGS